MKKNKILFAMHELDLGGAQRVMTNIVNNFNKELYDVHFCLFKKKGALVSDIKEEVIMTMKVSLFNYISISICNS